MKVNSVLFNALQPLFDLPKDCTKITITMGVDQMPTVELDRILREPGKPTIAVTHLFELGEPRVLASVCLGPGEEVTDITSTSRAFESEPKWPKGDAA